jgi:catechol 2,3-dioxygenase-like lactoylglutathione lyase family enzyme
MNYSMLHHVSIVCSDLERSSAFYAEKLGMTQIPRPPFSVAGTWFSFGASQLHLIANPKGTFRKSSIIDTGDTHFALRVDNFEAVMRLLLSKGFREDAAEDDPTRLLVKRNSVAKFPQAYLLDPDWNIVEINGAA